MEILSNKNEIFLQKASFICREGDKNRGEIPGEIFLSLLIVAATYSSFIAVIGFTVN